MRRAALLAVVGVVVLFYSSPAPAQSTSAAQSTSSSSLGTAAAPGTTIKVNTNADESNTDGDCSLREAIKAANTNLAVDGCAAGSSTDRDAIHFALGTQATITLGSTLPTITDPSGLTIDGQKAKITVSGDDKVRVFRVAPVGKLALLHLTVANGSRENVSQGGGGLLNDSGKVKVSNSTFSRNSAFIGGAIRNDGGTLEVSNSTFSGNGSTAGGGGLWIDSGTVRVNNSTFSRNIATFHGRGGSIEKFEPGKATLKNTIVANSLGGNCGGQITDGGYNIDDGNSCSFRAANHSLPSTNPKLASKPSLANNGGPTKTIALLTGSPAINAIPQGTNGCGTKITTDQRGVSRPQGNRCDIGAFEKRQ
jgi:CSLREA domain-containing protein